MLVDQARTTVDKCLFGRAIQRRCLNGKPHARPKRRAFCFGQVEIAARGTFEPAHKKLIDFSIVSERNGHTPFAAAVFGIAKKRRGGAIERRSANWRHRTVEGGEILKVDIAVFVEVGRLKRRTQTRVRSPFSRTCHACSEDLMIVRINIPVVIKVTGYDGNGPNAAAKNRAKYDKLVR